MRRLPGFLLLAVFSLGLAACGRDTTTGDSGSTEDTDTNTDTDTDTDTDPDVRTLGGAFWCGAGSLATDGRHTHAGCLAPVDLAAGSSASDGHHILFLGPFRRISP
jgi:hypothetical protein